MENWKPGTTVGRYRLIARIGSGGMGEVWKAHDSELNRSVAIKRLFSVDESVLEEARAIAALNHPHICTVHDVGPGYFVMELLEGRPVAGPLAPDSAAAIALQVATALEAAHARGVVHCDLKPANVVVAAGRVKLVDFGIARQRPTDADATVTLPTPRGSPGYMSPEQVQGRAADVRSDIFSFGALLYELLAGRPAFGGESAGETLAAVLRDRPVRLSAPDSSWISSSVVSQRIRTPATRP
jgi:eukaryotic-like serine/threonine-protein kinase